MLNKLTSGEIDTGDVLLEDEQGQLVPAAERRNSERLLKQENLILRGIVKEQAYELQRRDNLKTEEIQESLKDTLIKSIKMVSQTIEKRDPSISDHQNRVEDLAVAIAEELGLSPDIIKGIRLGSSIHDIGDIYVPSEILNRPGKLTDAEFGLIKNHVQVGYDIISIMDFPWPVSKMVLQHHERLDGSGYPLGLVGDDIILEARVIAVADVVEAINSHRPFRPSLGIDVALNEIRQGRGAKYDPDIVDACLNLFTTKGYQLLNVA